MLNWDQVTSTKKNRGLAIREARKENIAQLAKHGSNLATGSNAIWA